MPTAEKRARAIEEKAVLRREHQIRATVLKENGYSDAEIAKVLGVSEGTVKNYISKGETANDQH